MQIGQDFRDYWLNEIGENGENFNEKIMLDVLRQILIGIDELHQKS